jgi:hypothetical protein
MKNTDPKQRVALVAIVAACILSFVSAIVFCVLGMQYDPLDHTNPQFVHAMTTENFMHVAAHDPQRCSLSDEDLNTPLYGLSKPITVNCAFEDGKITITDETNGLIYSGSYEKTTLFASKSKCYYDVTLGERDVHASMQKDVFIIYCNEYTLFFRCE